MSDSIETDVLIIGGGPVGLFAVFELGLLGLNATIVDVLDKPGGQCAELCPERPIHDVPAWPRISGQQLADKLLEQIRPFTPRFHCNEFVTGDAETGFEVGTDGGRRIHARAIVIAAGGESFQPKRPPIAGVEAFEGIFVFCAVRKRDTFRDKDVVIVGGGNSALDWCIDLAEIAKGVTLVHRRPDFRAAPASVGKMRALVDDGRMSFHVGQIAGLVGEEGLLRVVQVKVKGEDNPVSLDCDCLLPFFGLTMKLGPVSGWGLALSDNLVAVDADRFSTSREGIIAIGDINTCPGKLKPSLSGFHESALMSHAAKAIVHPDEKVVFQCTASSSKLQGASGVA